MRYYYSLASFFVFLLILFILFFPTKVEAMTISGHVSNSSNTSLQNVNIEIYDSSKGGETPGNSNSTHYINTDSSGNFSDSSLVNDGDGYAVRVHNASVQPVPTNKSNLCNASDGSYENQNAPAGVCGGKTVSCAQNCSFIYNASSPQSPSGSAYLRQVILDSDQHTVETRIIQLNNASFDNNGAQLVPGQVFLAYDLRNATSYGLPADALWSDYSEFSYVENGQQMIYQTLIQANNTSDGHTKGTIWYRTCSVDPKSNTGLGSCVNFKALSGTFWQSDWARIFEFVYTANISGQNVLYLHQTILESDGETVISRNCTLNTSDPSGVLGVSCPAGGGWSAPYNLSGKDALPSNPGFTAIAGYLHMVNGQQYLMISLYQKDGTDYNRDCQIDPTNLGLCGGNFEQFQYKLSSNVAFSETTYNAQTPPPPNQPITGESFSCAYDTTGQVSSTTFNWNQASSVDHYTLRFDDQTSPGWMDGGDFTVGVNSSTTSYTTGTRGNIWGPGDSKGNLVTGNIPPGVPYGVSVTGYDKNGNPVTTSGGFAWNGVASCPAATPTSTPTPLPTATVTPTPTNTPTPTATPTPPPYTTYYKITEGYEGNLDSVNNPKIPYVDPTDLVYTFKDTTPGPKVIWIRFYQNYGPPQDFSKTIIYSPNPVISTVSCTYDPSGNGTQISIQGSHFYSHANGGQGGLLANNESANIESWQSTNYLTPTSALAPTPSGSNLNPNDSLIVATIPDKPTGTFPVQLTLDDGRTVSSSCAINLTTVAFNAQTQCRPDGQLQQNNVSINIYKDVPGGNVPIFTTTTSLDANGDPVNFAPPLEQGQPYSLLIQAPHTLTSRVDFTTATFGTSGGTTNISDPIILRVGDIAGAKDTNADGIVNSLDYSKLLSEWLIDPTVSSGTSTQAPLGDFNLDGSVNSIDYACLVSNYNQSSDTYLAPTPSVTQNAVNTESKPAVVDPTPSESITPSPSVSPTETTTSTPIPAQ